MSLRIYKYDIDIKGTTEIKIPTVHKIISMGMQGEKIVVWAEVNNETELVTKKIRLITTGEMFQPFRRNFIGTFQLFGFVGHLYEVL